MPSGTLVILEQGVHIFFRCKGHLRALQTQTTTPRKTRLQLTFPKGDVLVPPRKNHRGCAANMWPRFWLPFKHRYQNRASVPMRVDKLPDTDSLYSLVKMSPPENGTMRNREAPSPPPRTALYSPPLNLLSTSPSTSPSSSPQPHPSTPLALAPPT